MCSPPIGLGQGGDVGHLLPGEVPRVGLVELGEHRAGQHREVVRGRGSPAARSGRSAGSRTGRARSPRSLLRPPPRGRCSPTPARGRWGTRRPTSRGPYRYVIVDTASPAALLGVDGACVRGEGGSGAVCSGYASAWPCWACWGGATRSSGAHRHVPPGLRVRRADQRVGLDVDHDALGGSLGHLHRRRRTRPRWRRLDHVDAEAGGVGGEVDREHVAVERPLCGVPGGTSCRNAASRGIPTGCRSRRSRGSAPGR